ncbi:hypothetical protein GGX14DRAFT_406035 [Mycena pura]|uniref:Uncharacterized protein n=1 Tax=Mycena pura TaxID=153505 RepID=A0AAD6USS3_9AGAR|nr:hypothetical protein GGX14DRAFT_406035 [Mycena pura]
MSNLHAKKVGKKLGETTSTSSIFSSLLGEKKLELWSLALMNPEPSLSAIKWQRMPDSQCHKTQGNQMQMQMQMRISKTYDLRYCDVHSNELPARLSMITGSRMICISGLGDDDDPVLTGPLPWIGSIAKVNPTGLSHSPVPPGWLSLRQLAENGNCISSNVDSRAASVFVSLSGAVTLSLPSKINSGTSVTVTWTRANADPVSFGLMQRSLQENQPILSVTAVTNDVGATSGTASVSFDTPGLSPGETPNQLFAGTQSNNYVHGGCAPHQKFNTFRRVLRWSNSMPIIRVSLQIPSSRIPAPSTSSPPPASTGTSAATAAEGPPSGFKFMGGSSATVARSPSSTLASPQFTPVSGNSTAGSSPSAASSPQRMLSRAAVVALAVVFPLLALALGILLYRCRAQRHTRHRISQFTGVWLAHGRRSATMITSPGSDSGAARMDGGDPERDGDTQVPAATGEKQNDSPANEGPSPTRVSAPLANPHWRQKVELASQNMALQRGFVSTSLPSRPMSIGQGSVGGEPPPVYVESE